MVPYSVLGQSVPGMVGSVIVVLTFLTLLGGLVMLVKLYNKVEQGTALVRNGMGGTQVSFSGMLVFPVVHRAELIDISVKRIEIYRHGSEGLICQDNIRADIKVAFFVRVNKTMQDVMQVAQLLGCERASQERALVELFDAKFSEALKTVGKQFDFVDLYNSRERFKEEILKIIGTDLNGYVLDDAAIDYLEQTPLSDLNPDNILDADGIKKITDLTAKQQVLANEIRRNREKVITKQDVEAKEAILELQRQQSEAEEKQAREVAEIASRERAEAQIVGHQQRLRSEQARIASDEEIQIAEENKNRQVIVAQKNKARTEAVESERVEKDRMLEATERERIVTLAQIDKEKAVEVEKKSIQDVIRERIAVERAVVEEEERIKDTREVATADRAKTVAVTQASMEAEQDLIKRVKAAEADKQAAELQARQVVIAADGEREAAERRTEAKKLFAEAITAESAAPGLADAQVMQARADATEKQGVVDAIVLQRKAEAEAQGIAAKAEAIEKQGEAEAKVLHLKFAADAEGISKKAEAMKLLDGVGREHEEFKLELEKSKEIEIAGIHAQRDIARHQAEVIGEALRSAKIDIVGGDTSFFQQIVSAVGTGKMIDRAVTHSEVLTDVREGIMGNGAPPLKSRILDLMERIPMETDDIKNLSISALIVRMLAAASGDRDKGELRDLLEMANSTGFGKSPVAKLIASES